MFKNGGVKPRNRVREENRYGCDYRRIVDAYKAKKYDKIAPKMISIKNLSSSKIECS